MPDMIVASAMLTAMALPLAGGVNRRLAGVAVQVAHPEAAKAFSASLASLHIPTLHTHPLRPLKIGRSLWRGGGLRTRDFGPAALKAFFNSFIAPAPGAEPPSPPACLSGPRERSAKAPRKAGSIRRTGTFPKAETGAAEALRSTENDRARGLVRDAGRRTWAERSFHR